MEFEQTTESKPNVTVQTVLDRLSVLEDNVNKRLNAVEDTTKAVSLVALDFINSLKRKKNKGVNTISEVSDGALWSFMFIFFLSLFTPFQEVFKKPVFASNLSLAIWFIGFITIFKLKQSISRFLKMENSFFIDLVFIGFILNSMQIEYAVLLETLL